MPIDIRKTISVVIKAHTERSPEGGGIEIAGNAADNRITGTVMLRIFSVNAVFNLEVLPADIERAAKLLDETRSELGDYRLVCVEHGYYSGACMECEAAKPPPPPAEPECEAAKPPPPPAEPQVVEVAAPADPMLEF